MQAEKQEWYLERFQNPAEFKGKKKAEEKLI